MTQLPVKPGIDGLPTNTIPTDPVAFVDWFKNSFLPRWAANADARNAVPTSASVVITGNTGTPAGIGIGPNSVTNGELVMRSPLSVMGNATDVEANVQDIIATADGEFLQRLAGALVWGPVVPTINVADSVTGTGALISPLQLVNDSASPGNSEYYGTNGSGTKGFFPLPGGAQVTVLQQSGGVNQTYNVPSNVSVVQVICIGGGGGGGSGCVRNAGSAGFGGNGGGAGGISIQTFLAATLGSSVSLNFFSTTGGAGGAGATSAGGNGNGGTAGSNIFFGTQPFLVAYGGAGGTGSNSAAAVAGNGVSQAGTAGGTPLSGGAGNPGGIQSGAALNGTNYACTGGGAGGGTSASNTALAGGAGGGNAVLSAYMGLTGGSGGTLGGGAGGNGQAGNLNMPSSGGGGGGGAVGGTTNGGKGGNAGGFGAGGGGGGACQTGATSGAGGQGGPAACIMIAW